MQRLTHNDVHDLAGYVAHSAVELKLGFKMFPIPRGGVPAAYAVMAHDKRFSVVNDPALADFFIDDIIDSGSTMGKWCDEYPGKPFLALIDKTAKDNPWADTWVCFPWEGEQSQDDSIVGTLLNRIQAAGAPFHANDNVSAFIQGNELELLQDEVARRAEHFLRGLLIDVDNDHNTVGTAKRIAKMYLREVFKGRYQPAPAITDFPNAKGLDEMYMTGPITIRSACSHHFVPIVGRCWIGIVPGERVIGLSKFNRIVDWIASRPQIQEELVMQIADFIEEQIQPKGLAVVVEATHLCMTWRGVKEPMEAKMTTNVMRGAFRDKPEARAEFMTLVAKG